MIHIHPFPAELPRAEKASRVASVPYDVVSTAEARALAEGNEDSFLHVVRPEIDLGTEAKVRDVVDERSPLRLVWLEAELDEVRCEPGDRAASDVVDVFPEIHMVRAAHQQPLVGSP